MVEVSAHRDEWVAASPIKTIDHVIKAAPIAQAEFAKAGRKIAADLGIEFKDPGPKTHNKDGSINPKGIARTNEKIAERNGLTARVTDNRAWGLHPLSSGSGRASRSQASADP
jgi:hypothetical protein